MKPLYFGTSKKPLYGLYQPPSGESTDRGVVLCYPIGPEYVVAYPAFRQLATGLTKAGFHVFRFDFFGSGDSAGDSGDGDLEHWRDDLGFAIEELADTSGASSISLAGLRLGASIAATVAAQRDDIDQLVLWEPVAIGSDLIRELETTEREYLRRILPRPRTAMRNTLHLEVLGYPVRDDLRHGLEQLDLRTLGGAPAKSTLILERPAAGAGRVLQPALTKLGAKVDHVQMDGPKIWAREGGLEESLIPFEIVNRIVGWMKEGRA